MQAIIIDEEFRALLPPLNREVYRLLEEDILRSGCRDALVLWNGILIDGYNRYNICMEHDMSFDTVEREFSSREEVVIWIITNQVSRRNLTPIQLSRLRGLHYKADKKKQGTSNQFSKESEKSQNETFQKSTAGRLAEQYNVSRNTILRDTKLADAIEAIGVISPEAQRKILSGEVAINKNKLEAMLSGERDEIEAIAAEIEEGTYKRRAPSMPAPPEKGESDDAAFAKKRELETLIRKTMNGLCSVLRNPQNSGMEEFKTALRPSIDMLEDIYKKL